LGGIYTDIPPVATPLVSSVGNFQLSVGKLSARLGLKKLGQGVAVFRLDCLLEMAVRTVCVLVLVVKQSRWASGVVGQRGWGAGICNFSTDSCKFSTAKIRCSQFQILSLSSCKMRDFQP